MVREKDGKEDIEKKNETAIYCDYSYSSKQNKKIKKLREQLCHFTQYTIPYSEFGIVTTTKLWNLKNCHYWLNDESR